MRPTWLDGVVVVAAVASALTAAWLLLVVATVLHARDPSSMPGWTVFALALLAFATLTLIDVRRGVAGRAPRILAAIASIGWILAGGWILMTSMSTAHFEGYLVVIGAVVLVHGVASLAHIVTAPQRVVLGR